MHPVLTLAAGVAPHLLAQLWDEVFTRRVAGDGVPASIGEITPELLSALLSTGRPGLCIGGTEVLDEHSGTTARARLRLRNVIGDDPARPMPETVFVKLAPIDRATRVFVQLMGLAPNEVRFYSTLRDAVAPHLDVPRVHAARLAGPGGRFVLVLEDLGADPAVELRQGRPLSPEEARPVVRALARMQAALWKSPRFEADLAWLKRPAHTANREVEKAVSALATKPCLQRFGHMMPEVMQRAVRLVASDRDALERLWARDAWAFSHGDPHLGNFYFRGGRPGLFDWQVCQIAQGTRDLTYFLVTSVDRERLGPAERDLVGAYRDALVGAGVAARPLDDLMEEVRLHVLYVLVAVSVTAASSQMQTDEIVRSAIESCGAAIERHAPLEAYARATA